jgi:hypothetical protein
METMCASDGTGCDLPPPEIADAMTFIGDAWFPVHNPVHPALAPDSPYSIPDFRPLEPWVAQAAGTLKVWVNPPGGVSPGLHQSDQVFVAVRTPHSLVVKKRIDELYQPIRGGPRRGGRARLLCDVLRRVLWAPSLPVVPSPDVFIGRGVGPDERAVHVEPVGQRDGECRSRFGGGQHLWYWRGTRPTIGLRSARLFAPPGGTLRTGRAFKTKRGPDAAPRASPCRGGSGRTSRRRSLARGADPGVRDAMTFVAAG